MRTRSPNRAAQEQPTRPVPAPAVASTAPASTPDGDERTRRLQRLLSDLGNQLRRGPSPDEHEAELLCPTGRAEVDTLLGGGLPRGKLCEVTGPASSGRTSLALSLLEATTREGHCVGWVDPADAFDPLSAQGAGVDLERVLWVRPPTLSSALRCTERLLETDGFPLVVFDLTSQASAGRAKRATPKEALDPNAWRRLARATANARCALAVLSDERRTGAAAHIALELRVGQPRWSEAPGLLEGLDCELVLARHRAAPAGNRVALSARPRSANERAA